jgi:hypothetical protein
MVAVGRSGKGATAACSSSTVSRGSSTSRETSGCPIATLEVASVPTVQATDCSSLPWLASAEVLPAKAKNKSSAQRSAF